MKATCLLLGLIIAAALPGCSKTEQDAEAPPRETTVNAEAEGAKKEMNELPKTFKNRDYLKKNEPAAEPAEKQVPTTGK